MTSVLVGLLYISRNTANSVHGGWDNAEQRQYPDYPRGLITKVNAVVSILVCQNCHSANYEKTLDSIHAQAAEQGNMNAPICTDCHGAHDVQKPDSPRSLISTTCGQCHTEIYVE
jgi:predicted CXXCH cytochrome family protein